MRKLWSLGLTALFAFGSVAFAGGRPDSGRGGPDSGRGGPGGPDRGPGGPGGPGGRPQMDRDEVRRLIRSLEDRASDFRRAFDRAIENSRIDGSPWEGRLKDKVKDFERSVEKLRRESERRRDFWDLRDDVQDVVDEGAEVNRIMIRMRFHERLEREWTGLRFGINRLASQFRIRGIYD